MNITANTLCPVCGMRSGGSDFETNYQKTKYYFCSQQCLDNFNARPLLYIKSPKNRPEPVLKKRTLSLVDNVDKSTAQTIQTHLKKLMGIREIDISNHKITIKYDLLQVSVKAIEESLEDLGTQLSQGWLERIKCAWIQEIENNELDNLAAPSSACCNKAPVR